MMFFSAVYDPQHARFLISTVICHHSESVLTLIQNLLLPLWLLEHGGVFVVFENEERETIK